MKNMVAPTRWDCASPRYKRRLRAGLSLLVAGALASCSASGPLDNNGPGETLPVVAPAAETEPVKRFGDAADDPAILVAMNRVAWIAGTDKKFGLRIYDLEGKELHALATGRLNNVDAVAIGDSEFLLAASNRTTISIDVYRADIASNSVELLNAIALDYEEPYGLCMTAGEDGIEVFVGDKTGRVEQWSIDSGYAGTRVAEFAFDSQTEGCVFDADRRVLFVGEEERGIWAVDMQSGTKTLLDEIDAGRLTADVEGLDIYRDDERSLLLASSQGDNSFVVYDLDSYRPLLRFRVGDNVQARLDGVSETDGIAATNRALPGFDQGVLVVQDGRNTAPRARQNFKIIDWRDIDALLPKQGPGEENLHESP